MIVEKLSAIGRAAAEQVNLANLLGPIGLLTPDAQADANDDREQWAAIQLDSAEAVALTAHAAAQHHALAGELADITRELGLVRRSMTLDQECDLP